MVTDYKNKTTAKKALDTWLAITPTIRAKLGEKSSFYNYLARLDFMLLEHRISLERLTTLPCDSQQAFLNILGDLEGSLQTSHSDSQLLSEYLERMNLILD